MKNVDIANFRLQNQHLSKPSFKTPHDVVSYFGAVQAQDFLAAKWALGIRMENSTDAEIEKAFNEGSILRTHVMRPTWHFVSPENIRWMLELTTPRVKKLLAHYDRKLEIDEKLLSRCYKIITNVLSGGNSLTRLELAEFLEKEKIAARGQRLGHIVSHAELDALICSGERRGKQFTYALLEERATQSRKLGKDEALAKLTLTYFTGHGPAQLKDFAWWSGLTMKDAREGIEMVKKRLIQEEIEGKNYWFSPDTTILSKRSTGAFLLSIYDEYVIAYKDRSALGPEGYIEKFLAMGNFLTSVIIFDGKIVGTWKRTIKKDAIEITISPLRKLSQTEQDAISISAKQYGKFHNMPINLL